MQHVHHLVMIADRSGSMSSLVSGAVRGFNQYIAAQAKAGGITYVTTMLFDDKFEFLYKNLPISEVRSMTSAIWKPRGMTALRDALGYGITSADTSISQLQRLHPGCQVRTSVALLTDGGENESVRYSLDAVRRLVHARRDEGWMFLFQGANQANIRATAESLGIDPDFSGDFDNSNAGISESFSTMSRIQLSMRAIP